jgi:hypothetical protein
MKADLQSKKYPKAVFIATIFVLIGLLSLLFISSLNYEKTITQLNELESGNYYTKGFVSDIKSVNNTTIFKISDGNSVINAIIFDLLELENGQIIEGYCELVEYKKEKECIFKKTLLSFRE